MTDELKELMIHVERIVRPVKASTGRRMRMRRELLAHLQAAVEEERAVGGAEEEILERAKARLGKPEELTRELRTTVPISERACFGRWPMPKWMGRWEKGMEAQWRTLSFSEGAGIIGIGIWLTILWMSMVELVPGFMENDTEGRGLNLAAIIACTVTAEMLIAMVVVFMAQALRVHWRTKRLYICAGLVAILATAWLLLTLQQVLRWEIGMQEAACAAALGIGLVVILPIFARVMKTIIVNQSREWRVLDIAE